MLWKGIILTAKELADGAELEIQAEFNLILTDNGSPPGAILYTNRKHNPDGFCVFLTPEAAAIVGGFLGGYVVADCSPPNLADVAVLARGGGTQECD
jgi:hypothetical protein